MKVGDVIKKLEADGWVEVRQESSHRIFKKDGIKENIAVSVLTGWMCCRVS